MRRTAVVSACIAAFALIIPALGASVVAPPMIPPSRSAVDAARALQALSAAHPPAGRRDEARRAGNTPPSAVAPAVARTHRVQSGDTLWDLAVRYRVSVEAIAAANRMQPAAILQLGRPLAIPPAGSPVPVPARPAASPRPAQVATTHVVRSGETLWAIARRYGARVEDLMVLNDLGHSDWIKPGQRLKVAGTVLPRHRQVTAQTRSGVVAAADARAIEAAGPFVWPARGVLTSRFGWRYRRHHDGIDIAGPTGSPIHAARDGHVEFAGWKGGYGRVVFLAHGNGLVTVYGHASSILVKPGQRVSKGEVIARVGCTGSCTGSHLHFEVRIGGRAVDPLPYLNSAQAKR